MEKLKFITDTAADIPAEMVEKYSITMLNIPINIDGKEYFERKSFSIHEFYKLLKTTNKIPTTSRIPFGEYLTEYQKAYADGCTHVFVVTISSKGSGIYDSAQMAKNTFFDENPDADGKMKIHVVDSGGYTMAYGYPIVESAKMYENGVSAKKILEYLEDFFAHCEIYLACFSLEYAKKSGRISAAAAFVGDMLGLRPIISLIGGDTKTVDKVRGRAQLLPKLVETYKKNCTDPNADVIAICGEAQEYGAELQALLKKELKRDVPLYNAGASIVINSGPEIAAIVCRGKRHR